MINSAQIRVGRLGDISLIVPGTTIGVMLLPSYVEVRDKGEVKKKIRIHGKSFDYVLGELELYFRSARKILRPGLLEEVLIKIGLPKAEIILPSGQTPPQKEEKKKEEKKPEPVEKTEEKEVEKPVEEKEEVTPTILEVIEEKTSTELEPSPEVKTPKVMAVPEDTLVEEKKPSIRISISGVDDIVASSKTHITVPNHIEEEKIDESIVKVESEEPQPQVDTIDSEIAPTESDLEDHLMAELDTTSEISATEEPHLQATDSKGPIEHIITEVEETTDTDAAVIRPIIEAKGLILGEDIVGRSTLLSAAGFEPVRSKEDVDEIPYHFNRILKLKEHRVNLDIWHFDEAVKAGIHRKEFYESPDIVIVVYSVVDRWSFESITYWLKEIAVTNDILPPIVIVGNKMDLRTDIPDDSGDEPVTQQEGFEYAEELATTLARDGNLHPVAFIETSCETKEKVIDAFTIAAELFIKHRK